VTAPPVSTTVLTAGHRAECYASGLSDETIRLAELYSITKAGAAELLGYGVGSAGVVFPYVTTNGVPFARVKLDAAGPDGKRYRSPLGRGNHLYIPPAPLFEPALRADVTVPLYITEGEKKVLSGCQAGLPVLGLSGVWAWRMKSADGATSRPIPDLDQIAWAGRTVSLVFDSDVMQNPKVAAAEAALATELARRGATVVGLRLPVDPGSAKVGLDDYLLHHSVETFLSLPSVPLARPSALEGYLETMPRFLDEEDPPMNFLLPELLPLGVILLLHGEPRARKSLAAFELALAAATKPDWAKRSNESPRDAAQGEGGGASGAVGAVSETSAARISRSVAPSISACWRAVTAPCTCRWTSEEGTVGAHAWSAPTRRWATSRAVGVGVADVVVAVVGAMMVSFRGFGVWGRFRGPAPGQVLGEVDGRLLTAF
jgi:hypothetical protein